MTRTPLTCDDCGEIVVVREQDVSHRLFAACDCGEVSIKTASARLEGWER